MAPNPKKAANKLKYDMAIYNLDTLFELSQLVKTDSSQREMFKIRGADLIAIYNSFSEMHIAVAADAIEDFDQVEHLGRFQRFTDMYYQIKLNYDSLFGMPTCDRNGSGLTKRDIALPKVQLPSFTGKISEYSYFIDVFESMIGSDDSLSNTQKIYYLFGCLSGEAKALVQHLSISGDNYEILLHILKVRYGNKRLQADNLLNDLLAISHTTRNFNSLKNLLNTLLLTTKGLEKLQFPVDQWSYLLLYINLNKIDFSLKKQFEEKYGHKELPTFGDFIEFITKEVQILESAGPPKTTTYRAHISSTSINKTKFYYCSYCKGQHHITKCERFLKMKPNARKDLVIANRLCFRCLNKHNINFCQVPITCGKCQSDKHNTVIHFDVFKAASDVLNRGASTSSDNSSATVASVGTGPLDQIPEAQPSTSNVLHAESGSTPRQAVLLSTAIVHVLDSCGEYQEARALIDSGSQSTFVTRECVDRLGLNMNRSQSVVVRGIGGKILDGFKGKVLLTIRPRHSVKPVLSTEGLVLQTVASHLPSTSLPLKFNECYNGLRLADEQFYKRGKIDLLIGADLFGEILVGGETIRIKGLPSAVNTIFGYILMGPMPLAEHSTHAFLTSTDSLLEKFWEVEESPIGLSDAMTDPLSKECELYYQDTFQREVDGRYVVRLPFLSQAPDLGDSSQQALKRFYAMERRLQANPTLKEKYINFMKEYIELGHMSLSSGFEGKSRYIIPHHGVFKSGSDKIRVVFDASCITSSGVSLNDCLHAGPKLQNDITRIICRFRLFKIVFTTDIQMMFRMINVHKDDRRFQLIYWRESPDLQLQLFELNTVTYGMKCSPYLAIRTLQQLAADEGLYPNASCLLQSSVYMDDIFGGASTLKEAQALKSDLINLLSRGGFKLRKWVSNDKRILDDIPIDHQEKPHVFDSEGIDFVKFLGVQWNPVSDTFSYRVNSGVTPFFNKRSILSVLARVFDPMGWLSPVIFQGKLLMQKLWALHSSWDDPLPNDILVEWTSMYNDLNLIANFKLPRFVLGDNIVDCSLHGFSDASESGYAATVYIRVRDANNAISVYLVMAKSKVAPIKSKWSIPRLELCGAALLVKVMKFSVDTISSVVQISNVFGWCDSTIALAWIRTPPYKLQTFEGNRVSQIINCGLDIKWRHIPSDLNPADVASRGCRASDLLSHNLWWTPSWLLKDSESWPMNLSHDLAVELPGFRKVFIDANPAAIDNRNVFLDVIDRFSSFSKIVGVTAYCKRFIYNCKNAASKILGPLSVTERKSASDIIIKSVQWQSFPQDIELLLKNKQCSIRLRRLMPFVDPLGLLRVGGRLDRSDLPYSTRHPLLLPKNHKITFAIIDFYHKLHCHVGPTALQAILQKHFWILSARQIIRTRIYKCIYCFKVRPKILFPVMASLPTDRVTAVGAFHSVQTDFAGPFAIRASILRRAKTLKAYLCVFICSASKAVHLEVVSDLSTHAFLAALSRFTSRRGLPKIIRSDCGTNYIGSNRHLTEVQKYLRASDVQSVLFGKAADQGVSWLFNPPSAPHFGGLFEAAVKSAKTLLKRVIGEQVLTFEELTTVFARIEAVLNSRPLCPLSEDSREFEVLTPAHLLIGKSLLEVPEYNWEDIPNSRLSRFNLLHAITQRFWKMWSNQYLHSLQMRHKWNSVTEPPRVGDLVLIKDDDSPPLRWKRARVEKIVPGRDGIVRVVALRTSTGVLTRPVAKICRLPLS